MCESQLVSPPSPATALYHHQTPEGKRAGSRQSPLGWGLPSATFPPPVKGLLCALLIVIGRNLKSARPRLGPEREVGKGRGRVRGEGPEEWMGEVEAGARERRGPKRGQEGEDPAAHPPGRLPCAAALRAGLACAPFSQFAWAAALGSRYAESEEAGWGRDRPLSPAALPRSGPAA